MRNADKYFHNSYTCDRMERQIKPPISQDNEAGVDDVDDNETMSTAEMEQEVWQ